MMRSNMLDGHVRTALAAAAASGAVLVAAGALWPIVQQELGKRNDAADVRKLFRDIDKDGDLDVVLPGKSGLYLLRRR